MVKKYSKRVYLTRRATILPWTYNKDHDRTTSHARMFPSFIHSFILRHVHTVFQSEFATKCNLVRTLSVSSILSFPYGHPVAAYVFFLVLLSLLSFPLSLHQYRVLAGSSYARCDQTNQPYFYLLHVRLSSPPRLNVLLLHLIHVRSNRSSPSFPSSTFENFPGIFYSTFRSAQISAPKIFSKCSV